MNNKKSLTENILKNIGKENKTKISKNNNKKETRNSNIIEANKEYKNSIDNNEVKLDLNSFIMVPTNHPRIKEIIEILNSNTTRESIIKESIAKENNTKEVITLNEVKDNLVNNKIEVSKNSIITPLAKDYIKEKKIEVITTFEK
ncbi:hypothetical protein [Romboutsia sp.]|uniref:hypothetical protein n=1 Tax=Romboutsia sp. TaxID=1965302 RepID=UPI003F357926